MKLLLVAAVLSSSSPATNSNAQSSSAVFRSNGLPSAQGCPVNFAARRTGALRGLLASRAGDARPGAGFHLSLQPVLTSPISSAEVVVHASDSGPRVLPAAGALPSGRPRGSDFMRTFHLTSGSGSDLTHANVWLADAATLQSAELIAIEYRNGTSWHRSDAVRCVAVPDLLVLTSAE